jgi:hypothetical protein
VLKLLRHYVTLKPSRLERLPLLTQALNPPPISATNRTLIAYPPQSIHPINTPSHQSCLADSLLSELPLQLVVWVTTSTAREVTRSLPRRRLSVRLNRNYQGHLLTGDRRCRDCHTEDEGRLPRPGQGSKEGRRRGLRGSARERSAIRTSTNLEMPSRCTDSNRPTKPRPKPGKPSRSSIP